MHDKTSEQRPIQKKIEEFIYRKIRCSNSRLIRTLFKLISSIPFIIKCYSQILWLPRIIKGFQYKLSAQKGWREHYQSIAKHKAEQVEAIFENEIVGYIYADYSEDADKPAGINKDIINKEIKEKYERYGLCVPTEYLTNAEFEDKLFDEHDSYLASGGVGDFDDINYLESEGSKLLGGFNDKS